MHANPPQGPNADLNILNVSKMPHRHFYLPKTLTTLTEFRRKVHVHIKCLFKIYACPQNDHHINMRFDICLAGLSHSHGGSGFEKHHSWVSSYWFRPAACVDRWGVAVAPVMTPGNGNAHSSQHNGQRKPAQALVKSHILTHLIEGFVIQEGAKPFPVSAPWVCKVQSLSTLELGLCSHYKWT